MQLRAEDFSEAYKLHKRWGVKWWLFYGIYSGIFLGLGLWLIVAIPELAPFGFALLAYMVFMLGVLMPLLKFWFVPVWARRTFRKQTRLHRPYTLTWNENTFSMESSIGTAHTPWTDFCKWRENESLFLVYFSRMLFRITPKRYFADTASALKFEQLLREKIGPPS